MPFRDRWDHQIPKQVIVAGCRDWGRTVRDRLRGADNRGHVSGYASRSVAYKVFSERDGASHTQAGQFYAEVFSGDAIVVWRAIGQGEHHMPFDYYFALWCKYVPAVEGQIKHKQASHIAQVPDRTFREHLSRAYKHIADRWDWAACFTVNKSAETAYTMPANVLLSSAQD